MIRSYGNYQEYAKLYDDYMKKTKYPKTKYDVPCSKFPCHRRKALTITALAGNPIKISAQNMQNFNDKDIAFYLLHETGHHYNRKKGKYEDEKMADAFAVRWMKKLIDEKLLKEER